MLVIGLERIKEITNDMAEMNIYSHFFLVWRDHEISSKTGGLDSVFRYFTKIYKVSETLRVNYTRMFSILTFSSLLRGSKKNTAIKCYR